MTPEKTWRVFLNEELGTHIVLYKQEKVKGHRIVFGADTFDACIGWVNAISSLRPHQNYSVFRSRTTSTLLVLWAHTTTRELSLVYGPDTFDRCLEWARLNADDDPPADDRESGNADKPEAHFMMERERNGNENTSLSRFRSGGR